VASEAARPHLDWTKPIGLLLCGIVHYLLDEDDPGRLFGDLELVPPGLVPLPEWRPDPGTPLRVDYGVLSLACAGVARNP
jgi:hypothetical protein